MSVRRDTTELFVTSYQITMVLSSERDMMIRFVQSDLIMSVSESHWTGLRANHWKISFLGSTVDHCRQTNKWCLFACILLAAPIVCLTTVTNSWLHMWNIAVNKSVHKRPILPQAATRRDATELFITSYQIIIVLSSERDMMIRFVGSDLIVASPRNITVSIISR